MQVHILIVEYHHGREVYPCATYERARERLDQFVREWWFSRPGAIATEGAVPTPGDPASLTLDQRIETFFTHWQDRRFYKIEEYEVLT